MLCKKADPVWEGVEQEADLLIAVGEVHEAIVVVVVVGALGRVGGQEQVVGAQAVALRVCIREDARLQQLVIRVPNACTQQCMCIKPHSHLRSKSTPSDASCAGRATIISPLQRTVNSVSSLCHAPR